jgi:ribokinase
VAVLRRSKSYFHVSVGNLNLDIVTYVRKPLEPDESLIADALEIRPGGAAANYAVAASWFGHRVALISSISNQPLSMSALKAVSEKGVVTTHVKIVEDVPGMVIIMVYPDGNRSMIRYPGANQSLTPSDIPLDLLKEANVLHMASVNPALACEIASVAEKYVPLVSYDPGGFVSTARSKVLKTLKHVDILFLNKHEAHVITEGSVNRLETLNVELIVLKLGGKGALAINRDKAWYSRAEPVEKPVDTTGSGDAFDALFNATYIETGSVEKALKYATAAGALKASCRSSFICGDKRVFRKQLMKTTVEPLSGSISNVVTE